ncbi:MAG: hemolysin III family protein [Pseudomonadota bacterium]
MNRAYTVSERISDGVIHVIGVVGGIIAVSIMLAVAVTYLPALSVASLVIYGICMVAMFGFSAAYHLIDVPAWKDKLRRLDQAAIFLKIAATYTPFALIKMGGVSGFGLLGSVWTIAILGAVAKLMLSTRWDRLAIALYLMLGWAGLFVWPSLAASISWTTMVLLGIGGFVYSIGVIFHLWNSLPHQNAIWHLFVLVGTGFHFSAVATALFADV